MERSPRRREGPLRDGVLVAGWELRRLAASRANLAVSVGLFAFFIALVLFKHDWSVPVESGPNQGMVLNVMGSSALGITFEVVGALLLFFGVLVPFVVADAVARDHGQRVHELLMASALSTRAYVIGRFVAALGVALSLSILMVLGVALADGVVHGSEASFPNANWAALLATWLVLVVPAILVIGGVTFALCTLFPRMSGAIKLASVFAWVGLSVVVDVGHGLGWFAYWTPTSSGVLKVLPPQYAERFATLVASGGGKASASLAVQQQFPDLTAWAWPHAVLVAIGLTAAMCAVAGFRRFRNT